MSGVSSRQARARLLDVGRLAADLQVRLLLDELHEALTNDRVVVDDEHALLPCRELSHFFLLAYRFPPAWRSTQRTIVPPCLPRAYLEQGANDTCSVAHYLHAHAAACLRGRHDTAAVVFDRQREPLVVRGERQADLLRRRVARRVADRLLGDPIEVRRGREPVQIAGQPARELDRNASTAPRCSRRAARAPRQSRRGRDARATTRAPARSRSKCSSRPCRGPNAHAS